VNPISDPSRGATSASVADDNRATALAVSTALEDAGIGVVAVSTGPITIAKLPESPDFVFVLMDDVIYDGIDAIS
jgi:CheY-like chemotaxis protein